MLQIENLMCESMSWSSDAVKVYVTHVTDPLNFYARIGSGMLSALHVHCNG